MAKVDYEQKMNSKSYRFFDLVYRLLVLNLLTIILSITVVLMFPAIVASTETFKDGPNEYNLFKQYFINFKNNFKKSFFVGLILVILFGITAYAIYFYSVSEIKDGETDNLLLLFLNAGFLINFIAIIIIMFLTSHLPLLICTFKSLTVGELLKTSFYVTFRYILTTLILFICNIVIVGGFLACLFIDARILAFWMLIGISLPLYLGVKLTSGIYYKFNKINLEQIMHKVDMEDEDE